MKRQDLFFYSHQKVFGLIRKVKIMRGDALIEAHLVHVFVLVFSGALT